MPNRLQILVQGEPLDLIEGEETRFFITRVLQDLSDLSTRNSDFSNTISVPTTTNNLRLIDSQVPDKARFSDDQITNVECEILINGLPILSDSYFLVTSQEDQVIRLTVFSGTAKFFANISDDSIQELNFSDYDLNWRGAELQAIANTTDGAVYPAHGAITNESLALATAQGSDYARTAFESNYLAESGFFFYCHTVLQKIYDTIPNLSFDTSLMDDLYSEIAFYCPVPVVHDKYTGVTGAYGEARDENTTIPLGRVPFDAFIDEDNLWDAANDEFDLPSGNYTVRVRLEISIRKVNGLVFTLKNSGGTTIGQTQVVSAGNTKTDYVLGIETTYSVSPTDSIYVEADYSLPDAGNELDLDFGQFIVEEVGLLTDRVVISDFLPDISQRDFVKNVYNLFNIVPTIVGNEVTLRYFDSITKGQELKIDISKTISKTTSLLNYGQESIVKYADNEDVQRLDANDFFQVNSLTLNKKKVVIESIFSATDDRETGLPGNIFEVTIPNYTAVYNLNSVNTCDYGGGGTSLVNTFVTASPHGAEPGDYVYIGSERKKIISIPDANTCTVDVDFAFSGTATAWYHWAFEKRDLGIHLARIQTSAKNFSIIDGGTTWSVTGGARARFDEILWDDLTDNYYQVVERSLFRPFVVQCWTNIPTTKLVEVAGTLEAVYVDDFKGWFYINRIEQWKASGRCRLSLIELDL